MKILIDECDIVRSPLQPEEYKLLAEKAVCKKHGIDFDKSKKIDQGKKIISVEGVCFWAYITEILEPVKCLEGAA